MFYLWGLEYKVKTFFSLVLLSPNCCHLIHLDSTVDGWCIHWSYFPIGMYVALVETPTIWFVTTLTINKISLLDFMSFQFVYCTYSILFCTCVHEPLPIELWASMSCPEFFFVFLHFVGFLRLCYNFGLQ